MNEYRDKQSHSGESGENYNNVPDYCFEEAKTILDIGCMSGVNAILSKHRHWFVEAEARSDYLGVDILEYPKYYLQPVVVSDIMDLETDRKFDLVLALHIIEHIPLENWPRLFRKLKSLVAEGGYLVLATPYKERPLAPIIRCAGHCVFGIDERMIQDHLCTGVMTHEIDFKKYRFYRDAGETVFWAAARFVWRILKRHHRRWTWIKDITVVWKKGERER